MHEQGCLVAENLAATCVQSPAVPSVRASQFVARSWTGFVDVRHVWGRLLLTAVTR